MRGDKQAAPAKPRDVAKEIAKLRRLVEASRDGFLDGKPYILTYSDIIEGLREIEAEYPPITPELSARVDELIDKASKAAAPAGEREPSGEWSDGYDAGVEAERQRHTDPMAWLEEAFSTYKVMLKALYEHRAAAQSVQPRDDESLREALGRVALMAAGDPTWDLSPNDCAALHAVLAAVPAIGLRSASPVAPPLRMIDGKFGITNGGKLVKASSGEEIPEWEPLHVMRARDRLSLPLLRYYRELSVADGCNDYHLSMIDAQIARFEKFEQEHPEWMKQPGVTRGEAFKPAAGASPVAEGEK